MSARRSAHRVWREVMVVWGRAFVGTDEEGVSERECELDVSVEGVVSFSLVVDDAVVDDTAETSECCRHFCLRAKDCVLFVRSFSSLGLGWVNSSGAASSSLSSLMVSRAEVSAVSFSSDDRCWLGLESACLGFFEEPEAGGGKSHCLFPFLQPMAICQNISSLLSTPGATYDRKQGGSRHTMTLVLVTTDSQS